jgi:hypothetical protein
VVARTCLRPFTAVDDGLVIDGRYGTLAVRLKNAVKGAEEALAMDFNQRADLIIYSDSSPQRADSSSRSPKMGHAVADGEGDASSAVGHGVGASQKLMKSAGIWVSCCTGTKSLIRYSLLVEHAIQ